MAFTQAQLDALNGALATGELSVEYDGKRVQYRSIDELLKARNIVSAELAGAAGAKSRVSLANFSKG